MEPLVQYWHSKEIPGEIEALLATFRERNPDLRHLVLGKATAEELIAERYGRRELTAFRACGVPAMQADYLRYCAISALGGVYADVDLRCVSPLRGLLQAAQGTLFGLRRLPPMLRTPRFEWREKVGPFRAIQNNIFAFGAADHPLLDLTREIATANIEHRVAEDIVLTTGPGILTNLYFLHELGSLEAYLEYVRGGAFEPTSQLVCEVIGDYNRVEQAFADVQIRPIQEASKWVRVPKIRPAYKDTASHWINVKSTIYR